MSLPACTLCNRANYRQGEQFAWYGSHHARRLYVGGLCAMVIQLIP
jgi:hypothetical protein